MKETAIAENKTLSKQPMQSTTDVFLRSSLAFSVKRFSDSPHAFWMEPREPI
jgi:hypothetical protein